MRLNENPVSLTNEQSAALYRVDPDVLTREARRLPWKKVGYRGRLASYILDAGSEIFVIWFDSLVTGVLGSDNHRIGWKITRHSGGSRPLPDGRKDFGCAEGKAEDLNRRPYSSALLAKVDVYLSLVGRGIITRKEG